MATPTAQQLIASYRGTPYTSQQITGQAPLSAPAPAPTSTLQQMSIGLASGSIQNQADVNKLYGNESYGSAVPEATPETTRRTSSPMAYPSAVQTPSAPAKMTAAGATPAGSTAQGSVSTAGNSASGVAGGYSSRYGFDGMSAEEEELTRYLETPEKPKDEATLAQEGLTSAQEQINAINQNFNNQLLDQSRVNDLRSAEANAQSVLSGLTGSTEAGTRATNVAGFNAQENAKIQNQRALALTTLYNQIRSDARTEARQQAQDYRTNAKTALESMSARREANVAKAENDILMLGKNGTTFDGLKNSDPKTFQYLADSVGGEWKLKELLFASRPKDEIIGKPENFGGQMVQLIKKADGSFAYETIPLPEGVNINELSKTEKMDNGDVIMFMKDGTYKIIPGSPDTLKQLQIQKAQLDIQKAQGELAGIGDAGSQTQQVALVLNSLKDAKALSGASGRSGARKMIEGVTVGATDYTNLVAKANSIRANMLTLTSDPNIKKFFGPQMSNADVQFMMSAGTTLNPELQSSAELKSEIERLEKIFSDKTKWKNIDWGTVDSLTAGKTGEQVITAPDGKQVIIVD